MCLLGKAAATWAPPLSAPPLPQVKPLASRLDRSPASVRCLLPLLLEGVMVVNPHCVPIPHPRSGRLQTFKQFYPFYLGRRFCWAVLEAVRHTHAMNVLADAPLLRRHRRHPLGPPPSPPPAHPHAGEHSNRTCRRLHFMGTSGVVALAAAAAVTQQPTLLLALPLIGYGCAWAGHFFFEHNRPATFRYPRWSLRGDFQMWLEMLSGQRAF